jgi:crossover junction endodeoxyribonuclease RuvC
MLFVGIDPGLTGAVAALDSETLKIHFFDTPTVTVRSGKSLKHTMDLPAAVRILEALNIYEKLHVAIEKVFPMPSFKRTKGDAPNAEFEPAAMGVTSAFNFGMNYGQWQGLCAALKLPYELIHPQTWKASMMRDMGKEKDASRVRCSQLFPNTAADLGRKKDHARADALLIAEYSRRIYTSQPLPQAEPIATLFG